MNCPECTSTEPPGVAPYRAAGAQLGGDQPLRCAACEGYWFTPADFDEFVGLAERNCSHTVEWRAPRPPAVRYLRCPECLQLMARVNFRRTSGILLQRCPNHGWWCSAEQLELITTFFRSGRWRKQGPPSRPPRTPSDPGSQSSAEYVRSLDFGGWSDFDAGESSGGSE